MNQEILHRIEPRTLKDNVTDVLRKLLIDGVLAPGTEFNQVQIAEQLGVSRGTIREAMAKLEQEGLLQNVPYKGVTVTPLTRKYVQELYSVRIALELLALDHSVERITDAEIDELSRIVDEMREAARNGDLSGLVEIDLRFHEYLLGRADHELVLALWRTLEVGMKRCLRTRHKIYTFLDEVVGSHPTLITALRERNKPLAKHLLSEHITESLHNLLANWPESDGHEK